jgi:hypothetical protein
MICSPAELALDHVERQALARHLDGVGVPELVRCEAAPDPGLDRELTQAAAGGRRGMNDPRSVR